MYATKEAAVAAAPAIEGIDWGGLWDRFGGLIVSLLISVLLKVQPQPQPVMGHSPDCCDDHCACIERLCCIICCAQEEIKCHCQGCCNKP